MKTFDVILLTESRYENPTETDWYIDQVLTEDRLVQKALEEKGLSVKRMDWATPNFDWSQAKTVLFRTTWDYFNRFELFSKWLEEVSTQTTLINSHHLIHWNMDKMYLKDLKNKGVNIPDTIFIEKGVDTTLAALHKGNNWQETVLKPTFSGAARHTYKLNDSSIAAHEAVFKELIAKEHMMLQVFQHNIVEKGEISMILIDGKFTHAVLKKAKKGDFRVQDDFGGSVEVYIPTEKEILFAEKALMACPEKPIYARVDLFYDNNNELAVGELELIEPELWFRNNHNAANNLADTIYNQYF